MNIAIYGSGNIYSKYYKFISQDYSVVAIIDSDPSDKHRTINGHKIISPHEVGLYNPELVILMSDYAETMRENLIEVGYTPNKIVHYKDFFGHNYVEQSIFHSKNQVLDYSKSLLIISTPLGYHGGSIAILRLARCASESGYKVTVAASHGDEKFINELNNNGIDVIIQDHLAHASEENLSWVLKYDRIIVNTFPMIKCATKISRHKKVELWIHESQSSYSSMNYWHELIQSELNDTAILIYAVSQKAIENFRYNYKYSHEIIELPVIVDDWGYIGPRIGGEHMIFASIGGIIPIKGKDILMSAVEGIKSDKAICFKFVGKKYNNSYSDQIINRIESDKRCEYLGEKSIEELKEFYPLVDVVIVSSREETFSMVAAEAMMTGKVVIVSSDCGIAGYIDDKINGLIFPNENVEELAKSIEWCIYNREQLRIIGMNARVTYEEQFSAEAIRRKMIMF